MKQFAPERIFATVNGQFTRLPDGARQWVGGWSQDDGRPGVTEYVRADLAGARHREALRTALVAMKIASALPGVSDEYDFSDAIRAAEDALKSSGAHPAALEKETRE